MICFQDPHHVPQQTIPVSLDPDPVIDAYKPGVDLTLLRKNLSLSIDERFDNHAALQEFARELRDAGRRFRGSPKKP